MYIHARTAHTELIALSVATAVTLMDVALPLGIAAVWLVGQGFTVTACVPKDGGGQTVPCPVTARMEPPAPLMTGPASVHGDIEEPPANASVLLDSMGTVAVKPVLTVSIALGLATM